MKITDCLIADIKVCNRCGLTVRSWWYTVVYDTRNIIDFCGPAKLRADASRQTTQANNSRLQQCSAKCGCAGDC